MEALIFKFGGSLLGFTYNSHDSQPIGLLIPGPNHKFHHHIRSLQAYALT